MEKVTFQTPFTPQIVMLQNHNFPYMRIKIPAPSMDPFSWLAHQTLYPKVYYETPKARMQIGGVGCAHEMNHVPSFHCSSRSARFFGGMDFFTRQHRTWEQFPTCRYVLPLVEVERKKGVTHLYVNKTSKAPDLSRIHFDIGDIPPINQKLIKVSHVPSYAVWKQNVCDVLQCIQNGMFDKIVLARISLFKFKTALPPFAFCRPLQSQSKTATFFAYQFSPDQMFVGATPESLYQRDQRRIKTAAIAGTRPRGRNEQEDQDLKKELLASIKDRKELAFVRQGIEKTLGPLCSSLREAKRSRTVQTSTVQHLCHPFSGRLKKGVDDAHIMRALHPTPAVGGYPKPEALEKMRQIETFDRGWYAAPVGWIAKEKAHLFVAIRSALIQSQQLCLFAGTGIVAGSSPQEEWKELKYKMSQFMVW